MHNKLVKLIKATIIDLIVALLITVIIFATLKIFLGQEIDLVFGIANTVSIDFANKTQKERRSHYGFPAPCEGGAGFRGRVHNPPAF